MSSGEGHSENYVPQFVHLPSIRGQVVNVFELMDKHKRKAECDLVYLDLRRMDLTRTEFMDLRHRLEELALSTNILVVDLKSRQLQKPLQTLERSDLVRVDAPLGNVVFYVGNHLCVSVIRTWLSKRPRSEEDLEHDSYHEIVTEIAEISRSDSEFRQAFPAEYHAESVGKSG